MDEPNVTNFRERMLSQLPEPQQQMAREHDAACNALRNAIFDTCSYAPRPHQTDAMLAHLRAAGFNIVREGNHD